jgi:hypothetical protein
MMISDITGYTGFLNQSELEHAEDSLRVLLQLLIKHSGPPLVISRLEGDAVVSYTPTSHSFRGETLVDMIEMTYVAFKKALETMIFNTTCTCNACRNLPNLDLKFFVHYGKFMIQRLASYDELIGNDVNLLHRLVKNHISEQTGLRAYAAYTASAIETLGINEMALAMIPHTETYEHVGNVRMFVQDMSVVWQGKQEALRITVDLRKAVFTVEQDFPILPEQLWDYMTKPEYRAILQGSDSQTLVKPINGRTGPGAVYHCSHGKGIYRHTIIDWQPFTYYTFEGEAFLPKTKFLFTYYLNPTEEGTHLIAASSKAQGPLLLRLMNDLIARFVATNIYASGALALKQIILDDIALGKIAPFKPMKTNKSGS